MRATILELLTEGPFNPYPIVRKITERSGGEVRPSATPVHTALRKLEGDGLVKGEKSGRSTVYRLTDAGRQTPAWKVQPGRPRVERVKEMLEDARTADRELAEDGATEFGIHVDSARRLIRQAQQQ